MVEHRTEKGRARIEALKEAAITMFLTGGYEAASVDALIAQVGGSRRNIYDHFGGKQGLFSEVVAALCQEVAEPLADLVIEGRDPETSLRVFGVKLVQIVTQPRTLALHRIMIAEGHRFPDLAQTIWRSGHSNAQHVLQPWIEEGQQAGLLRRDISALKLSEDFVDLTVSATQLRSLIGLQQTPSTDEINAIVDHAVKIFLNGAFQVYQGSIDI